MAVMGLNPVKALIFLGFFFPAAQIGNFSFVLTTFVDNVSHVHNNAVIHYTVSQVWAHSQSSKRLDS